MYVVSVNVHACVCISVCERIFVHGNVSICESIYVCLCVDECMYVNICLCV